MAEPERSPDVSAHVAVAAEPDSDKLGEGNPVSPAGDPASPSPTPKSPRSSPLSTNARHRLLAALRAADFTVGRVAKLTSTSTGQERVFAITGYLAHVLHHILVSAPWLALLARLRRSPSPSPSSSSSKPPPPLHPPSSPSPPSYRTIYILTLLQVLANVVYQALENVAFLASKGVVSKRWIQRWGGVDAWYIWSTRAWLGHIVLQFGVLWRGRVLYGRRFGGGAGAGDKAEADSEEEEEKRKEIRAWRKSLVNNLCWAPLCLHWCFEKGIGFPEHLTGLVSFMAGAWDFGDSWARTAV
ncbi:hypothetical protein BO70DRAFT_390220 [Aspergillus heteromorphus CBS 117.55]|uniref:Uncharacterized protein n=1 Tax=Aspergillus heteromorphus CBS 117.55 TaxID=1448321 RepID=A0A317V4C4_9EURO|nr:uncharacterized protein BO70DRAFT_390220 [Aspergillus heteromorphus CBS 117.55]PWY69133.1 hypothetical protein BO70DRAFT_390220 [Aspergillus heteromorphus CBS 117.55]